MIGIVGGVGPGAHVDLLRKINALTAASCDQDHISLVMLSLPSKIPDRTAFLEGRGPDPTPAVLEVMKELISAGATTVAIPCNTLHAPRFFESFHALAERENVRLINMIDETRRFVSERWPGIKKVGVLATRGTFLANSYGAAFAGTEIELVNPTDEQKQRVHQAIYDPHWGLKASLGEVTSRACEDVWRTLRELAEVGCEAVILGCTELPLAFEKRPPKQIPVLAVDANAILAKSIIIYSSEGRLIDDWQNRAVFDLRKIE